MKAFLTLLACVFFLSATTGCRTASSAPAEGAPADPPSPPARSAESGDDECLRQVALIERVESLPGAPEFEERRAQILGRARGEPVVWAVEPTATPDDALSEAALAARVAHRERPAFARVEAFKRRFRADRPALRDLILREGYVYSADPVEALALVERVKLPDLFDEPTLWLGRGSQVTRLTREDRPTRYVDESGRDVPLLFADRVALTQGELEQPLHRDLRGLARQIGFQRATIERQTLSHVVVRLQLDGVWARALLQVRGAALSFQCWAEPPEKRRLLERHIAEDAPRRRALSRLHAVVDAALDEGLPFDRPRGEETADRDGQLRPAWRHAYLRGARAFSFEEASYPVYDRDGRPHPPQVCVDFVLDSFERSHGTWYSPLGSAPARVPGRLDFDSHGIENRRGVLALETFAKERSDLFDHRRFEGAERIAFAHRERFFGFLTEHAELFRPGDVVAIQGLKNDGKVHQHVILIEDTDPVTGFPDALADQMRRPRRRSWEGIMAEAPRRSLLFRIRPSAEVLLGRHAGQ